MYGSSRIAVAELSLQRIQPELCRSRFAQVRCIEELLLAFAWRRYPDLY